MALDALFANEYSIGAVEVFEQAFLQVGDYLRMVTAYELAADLQFIVRGPAYHGAARA